MVKRIIRNFTWLTIGNAVTKPVWLWFTIVLLAGALGEASYGVLNAALALMLIASGLTNLGATNYIVREIARRKDQATAFFTNFFLLQLTAVVIVFGIALLVGHRLGYRGDDLSTLVYAGIYAMSLALTTQCRAFYRAVEEMRWVSLSQMLEKVLVISGGTLFVLLRPSATSALTGMAAGMLVTLAANVIFVTNKLASFDPSALRFEFLKTHVSKAFPLGLIGFFTVIYLRTDQVMVEAIAGEAANGQYSMAYRLIEAGLLLPILLTEALFPRLSSLFHSSRLDELKGIFLRSLRVVFAFALLMALALFFLAESIIDLIQFLAGSTDFAGAIAPLRVLAWTLPVMAVNGLLVIVLTAIDDQRILAIGFAGAALANIVMNLMLIPEMGTVGAAYATFATEAMVLAGLVWRYNRHESIVATRGRS